MNKIKTILGFIPTLNGSFAISKLTSIQLNKNFDILKRNGKDFLIKIEEFYFVFNDRRIIKYQSEKEALKHFKLNLF